MLLRSLVVHIGAPADPIHDAERLDSARWATVLLTHERSSQRATARLRDEHWDIVVAHLHGLDAERTEAARQLARQCECLPRIALVPSLDQAAHRRILALGFDDVLAVRETSASLLARSIDYAVERGRGRTRQRDLEALLQSSPDAIVVIGRDHTVRFVNRSGFELFQERDLIGESLGFVVEPGKAFDLDVLHPDGPRVCEMRVTPLTWEGEPAQLATIRDITEMREAERLRERASELEAENLRVQEINRLTSLFVSQVSHELRTPLTAILGFARILHERRVEPGTPQHQRFLEHILKSARHLIELVNDVIDLGRLEAGKLEVRAVQLDLASALDEVVTILRSDAVQRNVSLLVEHDDEIRDITGDPVRIKQIAYNYLSNALKFTPEGGRITLRTRADEADALRLEVEDTGIGIAETDLDRVFASFEQLETGLAHDKPGSGLGLAVTRRIAEAYGGSVGVASTPGQGSTFFAVLPRHLGVALEDA